MTELTAEISFQRYFGHYAPEFFLKYGIADPYDHNNVTIRLEAAMKTAAVPGDVVQCGVYKGYSLATLALLLQAMNSPKLVWGLDSFEGFPLASEEDKVNGVLHRKTSREQWADTSLEEVQQRLVTVGVASSVRLVKGFYDATLPQFPPPTLSLLILDCDLYESYKICLQALYPRLRPGGIIIFDEYFSPSYPGARRAVDEFFADKPEKPRLAKKYLDHHSYERWYLVKE